MNLKTILSALAVVLVLAACGNKGPLVMPQKPVDVPVTPAPADAAPESPAPAASPADATQQTPPADGGTSG